MTIKETKIIFMGTSFFAKEILKNLVENDLNIPLVVTQSDKPAGRKKELRPSEVKRFALKKNLEIAQFEKLDESAFEQIKSVQPQLVIVASYGMIIPESFLSEPEFGYVNVHTSLLPELRGPSPIQTALLKSSKETGVTIMKMDAGVDSGDILSQKKVSIAPKDKYPELEKKLIEKSNEILIPTLESYIQKEIKPQPQDHSLATFTKIIKKSDGKIDWEKPAEKTFDQFRAFYDWPQIYSYWENKKGKKKIALTEIKLHESQDDSKNNGEVYQKEDLILVKTPKGSISIKKIRLEGKPEMEIKNFLNGYPHLIGNILE